MKNIPCLLAFSAVLSLILLAAAAALGVPLPFDRVAPVVVGFSCAAGVLGFVMVDYAPGRMRPTVASRIAQPKAVSVPAPASLRRHPSPAGSKLADEITVNLMGTFGARTVSATVSRS